MLDWFHSPPHAELLHTAEVRCSECFRDLDPLIERRHVPLGEFGLAHLVPCAATPVSLPDCRCGYPAAITEHHRTYWPDEAELPGLRCARAAGGGPLRWSLVHSAARPGPGPTQEVCDLGASLDEMQLIHHWGRACSVRGAWRLVLADAPEHPCVPLAPGMWAYATNRPHARDLNAPLPVDTVAIGIDARRGAQGIDVWAGPFVADLTAGTLHAVCLIDPEEARTALARMLLGCDAHTDAGPLDERDSDLLWATHDRVRVAYSIGRLMQRAATEAVSLAEAARAEVTRTRLTLAHTHAVREALIATGVHVRDLAHAHTATHQLDPRTLARVTHGPSGAACAAVSAVDPARAPGCGQGQHVGLLRREGVGEPIRDATGAHFVRVAGVQCPHATLALGHQGYTSLSPPVLTGHWQTIRDLDGALVGQLIVGCEIASALAWPTLAAALRATCAPAAVGEWHAWAPITDVVVLGAAGMRDSEVVIRALRALDLDPVRDVTLDYHTTLPDHGDPSAPLDLICADDDPHGEWLLGHLHGR